MIKAGPCVVAQVKTAATDGYEAVQLGLVEGKPTKENKPTQGHFKKAGVPATRVRREVKVAAGGEADPAAPARAARAGLASRTNTLFSIPMVFFMVAAQSFPSLATNTNVALYWILALIVVLAIELNALIGTGQARQKPLSTVSGTIHAGVALTFILFALMAMI